MIIRFLKYSFLLIVLLAAISGCSKTDNNISDDNLSDSLNLPDTKLLGARIHLYDRGKITTEILADTIVKFESIDSTVAYVVDVDSFDSLGHVASELTGDSAVIREEAGILHVYGHVVLITSDTSKLETEYLFWDSKSKRMQNTHFNTITKGTDIVTGYDLNSDQGLKSVKLRDASGTFDNVDRLNDEK